MNKREVEMNKGLNKSRSSWAHFNRNIKFDFVLTNYLKDKIILFQDKKAFLIVHNLNKRITKYGVTISNFKLY